METRRRSAWGAVAAVGLLVALAGMAAGVSGCTVRFISEHDPILDSGTSELLEHVESFLLQMERSAGTPAGTFAANTSFYDSARAELWTLRLRAESTPQSELLAQHYRLLTENVDQLAKLHQESGERGLHPAILGPAREALRAQFRALLTLHAALRRGESK